MRMPINRQKVLRQHFYLVVPAARLNAVKELIRRAVGLGLDESFTIEASATGAPNAPTTHYALCIAAAVGSPRWNSIMAALRHCGKKIPQMTEHNATNGGGKLMPFDAVASRDGLNIKRKRRNGN